MRGPNRRLWRRSREIVALLLFVVLLSPACASSAATDNAVGNQPENAGTTEDRDTAADEPRSGEDVPRKMEDSEPVRTVEAVVPGDILTEKELEEKPPNFEDWYRTSDVQPDEVVSNDSSVGDIPSVKPFNFGQDPGGPEDKTLYLTVPKLGLQAIPVFDEVSEEKLKESVVHVPVTGFPWQKGANTYIAGHRIGYPGTGSSYVFFHLDRLEKGDDITLYDVAGKKYLYRVTEKVRVSPDNVEVMEPKDGASLVSLQTCTLPDYERRLIVHGELVQTSA